jgi:hypothetical protein
MLLLYLELEAELVNALPAGVKAIQAKY